MIRQDSFVITPEDEEMMAKKESTLVGIWNNPFFLLISFSFAIFFGEFGLIVPLTYLPDAAVVKNISANYILTAFGIY